MTEPIASVTGLVKTFPGGVRALSGLDLELDAGRIFALLGPNGAGKTTLIRVLATLLRPDTGTARVAGADVVTQPALVRSRIGLAGQHTALDDHLTGRENIELIGRLYGLGAREATRRTEDVLGRIRLVDVADRQVRTYSGGMRRRIDLAASLVGRPLMLFLDEPTTGVDPASRRDIWDLVRDLQSTGTTVLLTTQYLEEADRLAERIGVIDAGRLVGEGTADELKSRVGEAVLELSVPASDRSRARAALSTLPGLAPEVHQADVNGANGAIVLAAPDGPGTVRVALDLLDSAGVVPTDIALHKPTLDDVFLALVGRTATTTSEPAIAHDDGKAA